MCIRDRCWVYGLMNRNDIIIYDKNSHASVINAIKMTGVPFYTFDPDDLDAFERLIARVRERAKPGTQIFSTVEGVRSIDGSVIDLPRWLEICRDNDIITILDDAHGPVSYTHLDVYKRQHLNRGSSLPRSRRAAHPGAPGSGP